MVVLELIGIDRQEFAQVLEIIFADFLNRDLGAFRKSALNGSLIEIQMGLQAQI